MVWSNWRKSIGGGAVVCGLMWSGMAWTQSPSHPADPADRIMVVNENNRKTRCRVEETWQLPDGRVAHLLISLDSGEKITIVDDPAARVDASKNPRAMPKRIFAWGIGRNTPPEGSPIPPRYQASAAGAQVLDFGKVDVHAKPAASGASAPLRIIQAKEGSDKDAGAVIIQIGEHVPPTGNANGLPAVPAAPMPSAGAAAPAPLIVPQSQAPAMVPMTTAQIAAQSTPPAKTTPPAPCQTCTEDPSQRPWRLGDRLFGNRNNNNEKIIVVSESTQTTQLPCAPNAVLAPGTMAQPLPNTVAQSTPAGQPANNAVPPVVVPATPAKIDIIPGKTPTTGIKIDPLPIEPVRPDIVKAPKSNDLIVPETKTPEKTVKSVPGPFSTATGPQGDIKSADEKVVVWPNRPETKPATPATPTRDKKDMWGIGLPDRTPPAKTGGNDPLAMPERFNDKSKNNVNPIDEQGMNGHLPPGAQSVMAARAGLQGPVTYIPVPTVTVPQPFNPPMPPEPKLPAAPQLNAYVNAFTPPPQPKGTQEYPQQGLMPPQAMNPMMQQQMMQQQMMMQQQQMMMMQQQQMNANRPAGYPVSQGPMSNFSRNYSGPMPPSPVGPGPVMPAAYGPMPNPVGPGPVMPAAYGPMQSGPAMQPNMPQQPIQQAAYQQPAGNPQIDQLIKVLRESPYPAQREWAAQSLVNFDWRAHAHIVPNLLQSAAQDQAASVRAGCVYCLGRMQASTQPVMTTLNAMRNDTDPRVRQEVERTLATFGQTPMATK